MGLGFGMFWRRFEVRYSLAESLLFHEHVPPHLVRSAPRGGSDVRSCGTELRGFPFPTGRSLTFGRSCRA